MSIRFVSHKDIDPVKWDDCVSRAFNGCVYGYSWYLDRMCNSWMALINNDYETIMPLPIAQFNGKNIIDQPILTRFLGVFTTKMATAELLQEFMNAIPDEFKYVSLVLNKFNAFNTLPTNYSTSLYSIYSIDLISNYTKLSRNYSREALEQIQTAHNHKIVVLSGIQPREFMSFYTNHLPQASDQLDETNVRRLRSLISHSIFHNFGEIYGAYDASNNLCAAIFLLSSNQKVTIPLYVTNSEFISTAALYLIFDHFIKKQSEKNIILTLETANNKNNIFLNFGAITSNCVVLKKNKLPLWQRWMK